MGFSICHACNKSISEGAGFCSHCGAAILQSKVVDASLLGTQDEPQSNVDIALPPFFAVSVWKLAIMSFFTFGLYEFYWFYRNWQRVRVREQTDISPFWRAFFGFFFCHACFERMERFGVKHGIAPGPPITVLTVGWIITTITWRLPDPFWLVSLLSFAFLLPMQAYVNRVAAVNNSTSDPNSRLTGWNWVGIVVGGCLLVLDLIGLFGPKI